MLLKKKIKINLIKVTVAVIITMMCFPLILTTAIIYVLYKLFKYLINEKWYKNRECNYLNIQRKIQFMDGRTFEIFCAELFKQLGYKAIVTQATNDGGKDIILKKNNIITYVECKRWYEKYKVGRECLQKLVGCATGDRADNMIFITTSNYNNNAIEYANKVPNLKLWTTADLMNQLNQLNSKQINMIFEKISLNNFRNELKKGI